MDTDKNIKKEYPESALTSKIINCAFKVFNNLGYGLPERVYQKTMAEALKESGLRFSREKYGAIKYNGRIVGKYFLDFLVNNKVAVEFKVRNELFITDKTQLLGYLKSQDLKVGLLIIMTKHGVKIKRLVN